MTQTEERTEKICKMKDFALAVKEMLAEHYTDCQVAVHEVTKNNSLKLTAVTINSHKTNMSPNIYLDDYFKQYKTGRPLESIGKEVIALYEKHKTTQNFDVGSFMDFNKVSKSICFKLINAEKNAELLKEIPHRLYQDLAVVYYVMVSREKDATATALISNYMVRAWNTDEETLYGLAKKNTPLLYKGCIRPISEVIFGMFEKDVDVLDKEEDIAPFCLHLNEEDAMYVATNTDNSIGAAILLYDGVLKTFAEQTGGDFYILPSSIHETMFVPAYGKRDDAFMLSMVRNVNRENVAPEEVLSDNVYYYHAKTDCVEMIKE